MDEELLYNFNGNGLASQAYNGYNYNPALTRPLTNIGVQPQVQQQQTPVSGISTGSGAPSWMANAQALGSLGLGLASFLDQRKTAGLQRAALRQNLDVSREHQANRRALGASWNQGWSQS